MHKMEMLRDRLCEELEELANVEKISTSSLDAIDKLTHSIKSIDTIMAMENSGYSYGNSYAYGGGGNSNGMSYGNSYAYGGGNSNAYGNSRGYSNARNRDSMGRYSNKWEDKEAMKAELMDRIRELDEQH